MLLTCTPMDSKMDAWALFTCGEVASTSLSEMGGGGGVGG
jgi:hypothetical protein